VDEFIMPYSWRRGEVVTARDKSGNGKATSPPVTASFTLELAHTAPGRTNGQTGISVPTALHLGLFVFVAATPG
jgi:hypothetical protein